MGPTLSSSNAELSAACQTEAPILCGRVRLAREPGSDANRYCGGEPVEYKGRTGRKLSRIDFRRYLFGRVESR
jgi:hypothetical protein